MLADLWPAHFWKHEMGWRSKYREQRWTWTTPERLFAPSDIKRSFLHSGNKVSTGKHIYKKGKSLYFYPVIDMFPSNCNAWGLRQCLTRLQLGGQICKRCANFLLESHWRRTELWINCNIPANDMQMFCCNLVTPHLNLMFDLPSNAQGKSVMTTSRLCLNKVGRHYCQETELSSEAKLLASMLFWIFKFRIQKNKMPNERQNHIFLQNSLACPSGKSSKIRGKWGCILGVSFARFTWHNEQDRSPMMVWGFIGEIKSASWPGGNREYPQINWWKRACVWTDIWVFQSRKQQISNHYITDLIEAIWLTCPWLTLGFRAQCQLGFSSIKQRPTK